MHTLHLTGINEGQNIRAIKGVRAALKEAGQEAGLNLSKKIVDSFVGVPVLLVENEDRELVERAGLAFEQGCAGEAGAEIDLDIDVVAGRGEPVGQQDFELAVYETGYVLLAACDGNPLSTMVFASALGRSTQDELFGAVVESLQLAFPQLRKLNAEIESEDDDDGS